MTTFKYNKKEMGSTIVERNDYFFILIEDHIIIKKTGLFNFSKQTIIN